MKRIALLLSLIGLVESAVAFAANGSDRGGAGAVGIDEMILSPVEGADGRSGLPAACIEVDGSSGGAGGGGGGRCCCAFTVTLALDIASLSLFACFIDCNCILE